MSTPHIVEPKETFTGKMRRLVRSNTGAYVGTGTLETHRIDGIFEQQWLIEHFDDPNYPGAVSRSELVWREIPVVLEPLDEAAALAAMRRPRDNRA